MLSSARRQTDQLRRPTKRIPTICVVDPQIGDYQGWDDLADTHGVQLRILASAEDALRFSRTTAVDLWVVNVTLPGLSGMELCGMLKARDTRSPVYLVAEEYSTESERAAWAARATVFGCKGAHVAWLRHWLLQGESTSTRSPLDLGCGAH